MIAAIAFAAPAAAGADPRVFSLDQCADQYVLALSPPADIVGLSPRARAQDSYMRGAVGRAPIRRASAEAILAAHPDVVLRTWGGGPSLDRLLTRRGVKVVQLDSSTDFEGVRADIRRAAAALGQKSRGEALAASMDAQLAAAKGAWGGRRGLYLTPGAFTAGSGTLVGAMMGAAGLVNAASAPGYAPVPLERLVLSPPAAVVLGFFETAANARWSPGRHPVMQKLARDKAIASLPGALLGCPGWFAADGSAALARAARVRGIKGAR